MNHDEANINPEGENQDIDSGNLVRLNDYYSYDPQLNTIGLTSTLERLDHEKLDRQAQTFVDQETLVVGRSSRIISPQVKAVTCIICDPARAVRWNLEKRPECGSSKVRTTNTGSGFIIVI
jgi:hypothetical protein